MDKKKGIINVAVSIVFRIVLLISSLIVRRYLIQIIGDTANGLDSLYTSIIGFLSVAELGIGSAIIFCMYTPIIKGDKEKISALFWLFKKLNLIIGCIVFISGCLIMPAIPFLAKGYNVVDTNIYFTFGLMLISVVLSYAFSAEISLINAYKNNHITTCINSGGLLLQYFLQIVVLIFTQSFIWYIAVRIIAVIIQWVITKIVTYRKYKDIISDRQKINVDTKKKVAKNIKAMFMHKIGNILVNTVDSIIISAFIGVVILGKYTNYTVIMTAMTGTITLFFTPLTSVIGHMCVEENKEHVRKYYNFFYSFNLVIGIIFFFGYYAIIDNIVGICFGNSLIMNRMVSFVITVNYFVQFMRQSTLLFRDATGTFYNDRWKPIIEGLINIALSISFVYLFGYIWNEDYAVIGVIMATIITNIFICHIIEPHVLYKYALNAPPTKHYIRNYLSIFIFAATLVALHFSLITNDNQWIELFANGGISLAYSLSITTIFLLIDKNFRQHMIALIKLLKHRSNNKNQKIFDASLDEQKNSDPATQDETKLD